MICSIVEIGIGEVSREEMRISITGYLDGRARYGACHRGHKVLIEALTKSIGGRTDPSFRHLGAIPPGRERQRQGRAGPR